MKRRIEVTRKRLGLSKLLESTISCEVMGEAPAGVYVRHPYKSRQRVFVPNEEVKREVH